MIKLSIIVATEGKRESLERTLRSAMSQLAEFDTVYVVGPRSDEVVLKFPRAQYIPSPPGHDWGNAERNLGLLYARGTHVMFIDDDDAYLPGALEVVRTTLDKRPHNCHMFRMIDKNGLVLWQTPELKKGNVGTPMFVAPNVRELLGSWTLNKYEGDFDFMRGTLAHYSTPTNSGEETLVWDSNVIVGCRSFGGA